MQMHHIFGPPNSCILIGPVGRLLVPHSRRERILNLHFESTFLVEVVVMKRSLLLALAFVLFAGTASAQAGSITIYGDMDFMDCRIEDKIPSLVQMYVVHAYAVEVTGSRWKMKSNCNQMMYISEVSDFSVTGNTRTGISVDYGVCLVSPVLVVTVNWFGEGLTPDCCFVWIRPDPAAPSGEIEAVDCFDNVLTASGGAGIINSTSNCTCDCCNPVEATTWGRVKALFQ